MLTCWDFSKYSVISSLSKYSIHYQKYQISKIFLINWVVTVYVHMKSSKPFNMVCVCSVGKSECSVSQILQNFLLKCVTYLIGRRPTITAAEMKEFETQMNCLGWSVVVMFNTDHGETLTTKNNCCTIKCPSSKWWYYACFLFPPQHMTTAEIQVHLTKRLKN